MGRDERLRKKDSTDKKVERFNCYYYIAVYLYTVQIKIAITQVRLARGKNEDKTDLRSVRNLIHCL